MLPETFSVCPKCSNFCRRVFDYDDKGNRITECCSCRNEKYMCDKCIWEKKVVV